MAARIFAKDLSPPVDVSLIVNIQTKEKIATFEDLHPEEDSPSE